MEQSVTLKDIAQELGLSAKAVSTGINGTGRLSPETRKKIQEKAREMGYRPNITAKALVSGRSRSLAMVAGDLTDLFFAGVANAALQESARLGYQLLLGLTRWSQDEERCCLENLTARNPDGIIYCPTFKRSNPFYAEVRDRKYPLLLFHTENPDFSSIHADGREALKEAGTLLKSHGARSAALCSLAPQSIWKNAMEGAGSEIDIECQPVVETLEELAGFLARRRHPALIVKDTRLCLPLIEALEAISPGYRPEIIQGYGDFHHFTPHARVVGGVYVRTREMAAEAVRTLIGWAENGRPAEPVCVYLPALFFPAAEVPPVPEDRHLLTFAYPS